MMNPRESIRHTALTKASIAGLTLAVMSSCPPGLAADIAVGQGTGDRGADMLIDLLVLRPLGLLATGVGSVVFVVSLPFTLSSGGAGSAACELVEQPWAYTFSRPLGEVEGQVDRCGEGAGR